MPRIIATSHVVMVMAIVGWVTVGTVPGDGTPDRCAFTLISVTAAEAAFKQIKLKREEVYDWIHDHGNQRCVALSNLGDIIEHLGGFWNYLKRTSCFNFFWDDIAPFIV